MKRVLARLLLAILSLILMPICLIVMFGILLLGWIARREAPFRRHARP